MTQWCFWKRVAVLCLYYEINLRPINHFNYFYPSVPPVATCKLNIMLHLVSKLTQSQQNHPNALIFLNKNPDKRLQNPLDHWISTSGCGWSIFPRHGIDGRSGTVLTCCGLLLIPLKQKVFFKSLKTWRTWLTDHPSQELGLKGTATLVALNWRNWTTFLPVLKEQPSWKHIIRTGSSLWQAKHNEASQLWQKMYLTHRVQLVSGT